ncbi:Plus3 domain-containing protein [Mycena venus]|uniref:Plus3 domain-containing protein n=1 Tax=Mycena venus TaxID=2733690 RepID=A0A8H6XKS0_9AGAR|nr:Plus3 domain-containing protein [Mycena venus]
MSSELDDELLELVGGSSDKEKQANRKRNRDASSSAGGKGKTKPSKKRKVAADSDNEPESEDGEDSEELYPLEGKYIDEEDRAMLLAKTEIEREEILTARLDEVERIRDRKHVDKLRAQQLAGVAAVESETKRLPRNTSKDKTKDKTLNALKAKRKAKDEKKRTRGASPKQRSSSPMDMDMSESESDSEDGQISKLDQEDERLYGKKAPKDEKEREDGPLTCEHLLKIALTRDALAKHSTSPWFEQIITGAWVRYCIGSDSEKGGEQIYRLCQIIGLAPGTKPYKLADNRTVREMFVLKHGKAERPWQMDRTSNSPWTQGEFTRMIDTCTNEKVPLPSWKEVNERFNEMQDLIAKPVTEDDISAMIARKRQAASNGASTPLSVAERARLNAQRTLAQRRQDYDEVREIDAQLAALAPPNAGTKTPAEEEPADRLARVNERNRKANLEAVRKAELLEAERKRRERKNRAENGGVDKVFDPSARLRTVPRLFESATPTSRPSTPNPATLGVSGAKPGLSPSPTPKPDGGAPSGKTFEATLVESIEVDLGDF